MSKQNYVRIRADEELASCHDETDVFFVFGEEILSKWGPTLPNQRQLEVRILEWHALIRVGTGLPFMQEATPNKQDH